VSDVLILLYGVIHLLSVFLAGLFGYWAVFRTDMRSKSWFGLLMAGVAMWALLAAVELVITTQSILIALTVFSIVIGLLAPLLWVIFTADYTHRSIQGNTVIYAVFGLYILLVALVITTPIHGYYTSFELHHSPFVHVEMVPGPARLLGFAYVFGGMALGTYYLASLFERGRSSVSKPTAILSSAVLLGIVPFAASLLGIVPIPTYDHTQFGISVFILGVGYIVVRYNFYNLSPIAREIVIDEVSDAVVVLDPQLRLVDSNRAASELFPEVTEERIGDSLTTVAPELAQLIENATVEDEKETEFTHVVENETRHLLVTISKIGNDSEAVGTVLLIHDVTERKEREQKLETTKTKLEEQNQRLDKFASVVSHDLRNPLNAAQLRLALIDTEDEEHHSKLDEALNRIEEIIEEMLTIARAGGAITKTEPVNLHELVTEAWDVTKTDGVTLESELAWDMTVQANPELLRHIFENLFRNAIDHNDPPLGVSVGTLEDSDGFFVADTGEGIPEDQSEQIFEHGYSTQEEGTGLGLAIVNDIVEGHGWNMDVTEGTTGGARFEIQTE